MSNVDGRADVNVPNNEKRRSAELDTVLRRKS